MKFYKFKGLIIISSILIILLTFYFEFFKNKNNDIKKDIVIKEENFQNSNIIKDIKYSSKDLKGNEYIIVAEQGEIDFTKPDIIFLNNVSAYIKLIEKNEIIKISSNFGKYNTVSYDTIFSKNVIVEYLENRLTGNYLDFSMMNNLLIMSKKVVYTNPKNILKADVIELDTITKNTKIFMYNSNNKVQIMSK